MIKNYKIILADLLVNTLDANFVAESIDSKISRLENALKILQTEIDKNHSELLTSSQEMIGMLVMPEYFFCNSLQIGCSRHYTEDQARNIEMKLAALSAQFPKILLVAPISWKKPLYNNSEYAKKKLDANFYFSDKEQRGITIGNHEKYVKKFPSQDIRLNKVKATINGSAGLRYIYNAKNMNAPNNDPSCKLRLLNHTDPYIRKRTQISRTTMRCFLNSKQFGKIHKGSDFREALDENNVFIPGTAFPEVVIDNCHIGIEICSDHKEGLLKTAYTKNTPSNEQVKFPDIHLISSAFISNLDKMIHLDEGGFFIHSSSESSERAYKIYTSQYTNKDLPITNYPAENINIVTLDFSPRPKKTFSSKYDS